MRLSKPENFWTQTNRWKQNSFCRQIIIIVLSNNFCSCVFNYLLNNGCSLAQPNLMTRKTRELSSAWQAPTYQEPNLLLGCLRRLRREANKLSSTFLQFYSIPKLIRMFLFCLVSQQIDRNARIK